MATPKLAGTGGSIERDLVRRWGVRLLRRVLYQDRNGEPVYGSFREGQIDILNQLRDWLKTQPTRTAKPGGIGKR